MNQSVNRSGQGFAVLRFDILLKAGRWSWRTAYIGRDACGEEAARGYG